MTRRRLFTAAPAVLVALLLALASCSSIEEPVVTITGVEVHGISTEGLALDLLVDVENPNSFGADISELTYRVLLDDTKVAEGLQDDTVAVPAESTVEVKIPFTIVWSGMDEGVTKLLDGEEHDWRLDGRVRLSKGAISRTFSFAERGSYEAPRASDIDIKL
jgi:LEA14-like dessication related protein